MNIKYFTLILILFIIILVGIKLVYDNIEGLYDGQVDTSTNISEKQESDSVDTTNISKWNNLSDLKSFADSVNYTINDWSTHLDIIIHQIGCPFYGYDTITKTWSNKRYTTINWRRRQFRFRFWGGWRTWTFYQPYRQWHDNWVSDRKNITAYKVDIEAYQILLAQITETADIKNDSELQKMITLNASQQGFSTIEGIENIDTIKKDNGTEVVNNNIVGLLATTNYSVTNVADFAKKYSEKGKTLIDIKNHITTMEGFGIYGEDVSDYLSKLINVTFNPKGYSFLDLDTLVSSYFATYGIKSVTDFFDPTTITSTNVQNGNFTNVVNRFGLHSLNIPLFPTTPSNYSNDSNDCVMKRLNDINGTNIPTLGKDQYGNFYINNFFQAFQIYSVNSQTFFDNIYTYYSSLSINNSTKNITDTLHYISSLYTRSLVVAFKRLNQLLSNLELSFNDYLSLVTILENRVGMVPYNSIVYVWKNFKLYYTNVAYSDVSGVKLDNPVTPNTLSTFLDDIDKHYSTNAPLENKMQQSTYFYPGAGNFSNFIWVVNNRTYKVSDIKRDISIGQLYMNLISYYNPSQTPSQTPKKESFADINSFSFPETDIISYAYTKFTTFIHNLIYGNDNIRERLLTAADSQTLANFGITDFDQTLSQYENILMGYNINSLNSSNTIWQNIITFTNKLVQVGVHYTSPDDFRGFINVLVNFGANTVLDWSNILTDISSIQITGKDNIKAFLSKITDFGVVYHSNYDLFMQYLKIFQPNLQNQNFSQGLSLISVNGFINDMTTTQNTYKTTQGTNVVNNIINYFSRYNFTLSMYYSNTSIAINWCNASLPSNFPSLLVNSLYAYGNTGYYGNNLYDIQTQEWFELCEVVNAMQEVYMLTKGLSTYNGRSAVIVPNVKLIISFIYKEEMDAIIHTPNYYSDVKKRILMIKDISLGIQKYSITFFKDKRKDDFDLYNTIATYINIFPVTTFQYISNEIISNCNGRECQYSIYVDPNYTESKANAVATKKTQNYRPNPPVL